MKKILFFGNSCTGKTTAMFSLISRMKSDKLLVGYVLDVCRFPTFDPSLFDVRLEARMYILFNQMMKECEASLRHDCDYMLSERSVLDWFIYFLLTQSRIGKKNDKFINALTTLVWQWVEDTYDLIIYMDAVGMYYVNDGYRPASTQNRDDAQVFYDQFVTDMLKSPTLSRKMQIVTGDNLQDREKKVFGIVDDWLANGNLTERTTRQQLYGKAGAK